jgi:PAB-dependent poly(A)-specific ribonuclease subunit 2
MPYYHDVLLSAWPSHLVFEVGAPPPKPDPAFIASLKRSDMGHWVANPKKTHRNQITSTRTADSTASAITAPKFLSEKARESSKNPETEERRISDAIRAFNDVALDGSTKQNVPIIYRNVEIKYSKFGVDDFDFE